MSSTASDALGQEHRNVGKDIKGLTMVVQLIAAFVVDNPYHIPSR